MSDYKNKHSLKNRIISAITNRLAVGIVILIFGIGMIVCPMDYMKIALIIIGVAVLAFCVVRAIFFFIGEKTPAAIFEIVVTGLFAVFGIICIAAPGWVISFVYFIFGAVIILDGASAMYFAVVVLRKSGATWIPYMILSAVILALGAVAIINPFSAMEWTLRFVGVALALGGIFNICNFFAKHDNDKKIEAQAVDEY